jgi:phosphate transport system substrate-binding protein
MRTTSSYAVALAALVSLIVLGCGVPPERVTVKGSDTMVPLGQRWAEIYMTEHPDATIQVTGGGSGTGIAALINGTTQICESSRPMKPEEKNSVKEQRKADVEEIPVALDALAVYVNNKNPIERLTMEQVARIYKGEITDWKDVGGPSGAIVLYGRENNSGTYVFFKEHVLENKDFAEKYQPLPGTAAVINAITKDAAGIGYGGIGYATDAKTISIAKNADAAPISPKMENVLDNSYPLSRQLFWYTAGPPAGEVKDFVDWVLSPPGQKIVSEVGYYPLKPDTADNQ